MRGCCINSSASPDINSDQHLPVEHSSMAQLLQRIGFWASGMDQTQVCTCKQQICGTMARLLAAAVGHQLPVEREPGQARYIYLSDCNFLVATAVAII